MALYVPMSRFESISYDRCRVSVYGGRAGSHQCLRAVAVTVNNIGYCRQHAPKASLPDAPKPVTLYAAYTERGNVLVAEAQGSPTPRGWDLNDTSSPFGYRRRIPRDKVGSKINQFSGYIGETRRDALLALQSGLQQSESRLQSKLDATRIALQGVRDAISATPFQEPANHED